MSSAWMKSHWGYDKLKSYVAQLLDDSKKYFVCGLPYQVSIKEGLDKRDVNNFYGLHRNNIANIVKGLIEHFKIILEINGVGFKAVVVKNMLILTLGYSHDIAFALPQSVSAKVEGNQITLESDDKQLLGQVASEIIALRKPEPYKGKGVKILDKPILRKEGKKK